MTDPANKLTPTELHAVQSLLTAVQQGRDEDVEVVRVACGSDDGSRKNESSSQEQPVMILRCTKAVTYQVSCSHQREHDPEDGTGPGWYAWVGPPGDQSDFAFGPCKTREAAEEGVMRKLERMGYAVIAIENPKPLRTKAMRAKKRKQAVSK